MYTGCEEVRLSGAREAGGSDHNYYRDRGAGSMAQVIDLTGEDEVEVVDLSIEDDEKVQITPVDGPYVFHGELKEYEQCMICLEEVKKVSELWLCDHFICFVCLKDFSKESNEHTNCPMCRKALRNRSPTDIRVLNKRIREDREERGCKRRDYVVEATACRHKYDTYDYCKCNCCSCC